MAGRSKDKGIRRSEGEWRSLLASYAGSGLGVEAFCRREAISAASFYRWRALLGAGRQDEHEVRRDLPPAFVDLGSIRSSAPSRSRLDLTLDLGEGLILRLVRG